MSSFVSRALESQHGDAEPVETLANRVLPADTCCVRRIVALLRHCCSRLAFWSRSHGAHSCHRLPPLGEGAKDEGPLVLVQLVLSPLQVEAFVSLALDCPVSSFSNGKPSTHCG